MTARKIVYVAHQLNAPTREGIEQNLREGALWCGWLAQHFEIAPVAPWIYLASVWDETPENRARGLEIDHRIIEMVDELWMVGPKISSGVLGEAELAHRLGKPVRDLICFVRGTEPTERMRVATELRWHP